MVFQRMAASLSRCRADGGPPSGPCHGRHLPCHGCSARPPTLTNVPCLPALPHFRDAPLLWRCPHQCVTPPSHCWELPLSHCNAVLVWRCRHCPHRSSTMVTETPSGGTRATQRAKLRPSLSHPMLGHVPLLLV
uniref:Uncharacterized protein n=1 Tax=Arundo donax TaxID=35708 RepID=A0A0A9FYD1_ARUDO